MHTVVKQILACLALLLVASGCQSGAGSGSWKWWGGNQNVKPDSQSALAGTPYDGVELPSKQVQPPSVETGEPAPKKTLATVPPGTPTSDAYASTATPAAHNASPDDPASRYPSTPYPATAYPSTPYPSTPYPNTPNAAGQPTVADATGPGPTRVAGVPPQGQQPTYPTTSFGPGVPPSAVPPRSEPPATVGTYPVGPGPQQTVSTPRAEPPSVTSPLGPRYNSTVGALNAPPASPSGTVVPPQGATSPIATPGPSSPLGPRYANLPSGGPRYDARPAPAVASTGAPEVSPAYPSETNAVNTTFASPAAATAPRYPQVENAVVPAAGPVTTPVQPTNQPFQPGSISRYVSETSAGSVEGPPVQPQAPYNPPPKVVP